MKNKTKFFVSFFTIISIYMLSSIYFDASHNQPIKELPYSQFIEQACKGKIINLDEEENTDEHFIVGMLNGKQVEIVLPKKDLQTFVRDISKENCKISWINNKTRLHQSSLTFLDWFSALFLPLIILIWFLLGIILSFYFIGWIIKGCAHCK